MVPVSTFARGSHGEFNENTHAFLYKTCNGVSKKGAKKMTPYTTTIRFGITLGVKKKKARGLTPLTCTLDGGRYKIRTCDPIRVKDMLYP